MSLCQTVANMSTYALNPDVTCDLSTSSAVFNYHPKLKGNYQPGGSYILFQDFTHCFNFKQCYIKELTNKQLCLSQDVTVFNFKQWYIKNHHPKPLVF